MKINEQSSEVQKLLSDLKSGRGATALTEQQPSISKEEWSTYKLNLTNYRAKLTCWPWT